MSAASMADRDFLLPVHPWSLGSPGVIDLLGTGFVYTIMEKSVKLFLKFAVLYSTMQYNGLKKKCFEIKCYFNTTKRERERGGDM